MKVCKNCGEINSNDSAFCCNCGKTSFVYQEEVVCPTCGTPNDVSFAHCINCGNPLNVQQDNISADDNLQAEPIQEYSAVPVDANAEVPEYFGGTVVKTETATCPSCGTMVPVNAIYCQKCGAEVYKLHEHRVVQRKVCPHCGRRNDINARYCSYCYASLTDAQVEDMQVVHETENIGEGFVKQAYLEDASGKKKMCPNCGAINELEDPFCVNCGLKLDVDEPKKYCPNCGAENVYDSTFCSKCCWSFDGTDPQSIDKWTCKTCNHVNDGQDNFCTHCGTKK